MDFVIVTALPLHTAFRHLKNFKGTIFCKMFRKISRGKQQIFRTHVGGQKCGYKPSMALLFFGAWTRKGNSAISQEEAFFFKYYIPYSIGGVFSHAGWSKIKAFNMAFRSKRLHCPRFFLLFSRLFKKGFSYAAAAFATL